MIFSPMIFIYIIEGISVYFFGEDHGCWKLLSYTKNAYYSWLLRQNEGISK